MPGYNRARTVQGALNGCRGSTPSKEMPVKRFRHAAHAKLWRCPRPATILAALIHLPLLILACLPMTVPAAAAEQPAPRGRRAGQYVGYERPAAALCLLQRYRRGRPGAAVAERGGPRHRGLRPGRPLLGRAPAGRPARLCGAVAVGPGRPVGVRRRPGGQRDAKRSVSHRRIGRRSRAAQDDAHRGGVRPLGPFGHAGREGARGGRPIAARRPCVLPCWPWSRMARRACAAVPSGRAQGVASRPGGI